MTRTDPIIVPIKLELDESSIIRKIESVEAGNWYTPDEVLKLFENEREFATTQNIVWLCNQLNLAFAKGRQLGRGEVLLEIDGD